jgi:hypothetical protein
MTLWQISAPHFVAGLEVDDDDMVCKAAPILSWTLGKYWYQVKGVICHRYRWHIERITNG